jgi:hypothetical protein
VSLLAIVFVGEFAFDFVVENLAIRLTHGYAYAQTYGPLTLWAGSQFQFPLYESFLVAALGLLYTWMRLQAVSSDDGLSPVERGFDRWSPALQSTVRTLAAIGFCCAATILIYHLPSTGWALSERRRRTCRPTCGRADLRRFSSP